MFASQRTSWAGAAWRVATALGAFRSRRVRVTAVAGSAEDAVGVLRAVFGATISAFAATLGAATAASRILFAISRDGFSDNRLGRTSTRSGAPAGALVVIMGIAVVALLAYRINGTDAVNAFFYPGTMGVLLMLVSYIVCNVGAIVFLYFRGERKVPMLEIVIPLIALAIIFYVLYQNTLADSLEYPYTVFPLIVAGWLVLGFLIIALVPGLARRIGEGLAREEGMRVAGRDDE